MRLCNLQHVVSIPAGFSNALRPCAYLGLVCVDLVSIPAGFSNALRPEIPCELSSVVVFQSLLGFLMRCDSLTVDADGVANEFQSLLGFLMRCDGISAPGPVRNYTKFQSLLGFLMRCDLQQSLSLS